MYAMVTAMIISTCLLKGVIGTTSLKSYFSEILKTNYQKGRIHSHLTMILRKSMTCLSFKKNHSLMSIIEFPAFLIVLQTIFTAKKSFVQKYSKKSAIVAEVEELINKEGNLVLHQSIAAHSSPQILNELTIRLLIIRLVTVIIIFTVKR